MKEYIKLFSNFDSANNYKIVDIPFTTTIGSEQGQNLVCEVENKMIEVDEQGNINIVDAPPVPSNDEIWYTSSDGNIVTPYQVNSLPQIVSNTYVDGKGVIKFATNVINIGIMAFQYCPFTSVTIPNSVTNIGDFAFYGCNGLTSIEIPNRVTNIGVGTFCYCTSLTSVTIPDSVVNVEISPFIGCRALTNPVYNSNVFMFMPLSYTPEEHTYTIPGGIKYICGNAFSDSNNVYTIILSNNVNINVDAFYYGEDSSYSYPGKITKIIVGDKSFEYSNTDEEFLTIELKGVEVNLHMWSYYNDDCIVKDTPITLSDGTTKMIQDITYDDELLVWDFDNAQYSSAKPLWIRVAHKTKTYWLCNLENGLEIKLVGNNGKSHRLFNYTDQVFEYPQDCVGKEIFTENGISKLVSCECNKEEVEYYNIITNYHINLFANSILTSCRYNNIYDIKDMKFVKDDRTTIPQTEYVGVPEKYYLGMRLGEQTIPVKDTIEYVQNLINKEK